jgi:MoaA/NifB/PqqE/SkfB family radical SAM enzyme
MAKDFLDVNKIIYYPDKLSMWLKGDYNQIHPITVELHISGRCNNNCYYCFDKSNKSGKLMTKEKCFLIVDKLKEMGVKGIVLSGGGEPTMNQNIGEIIKYIYKQDIEIGLITNGIKISKKLNLDANKVLANLIIMGAEKKHCTVGAQIVVNKYNMGDLWKTAYDLSGINLDYLQIRPLENVEYDNLTLKYIKNQLKVLKEVYKDWLVLPQKWDWIGKNRGYNKCWCYPFIGTITVDGDIYICCHHINNKNYCYGNLLSDSVVDVIDKRDIAAKNINLKHCPKLCRGASINMTLEKIKRGIAHVKFL